MSDSIATTKRAAWSLMMPVVILGSIYGGIATPTEAAGFACIYAIFVTVVVHRELRWNEVLRIAVDYLNLLKGLKTAQR